MIATLVAGLEPKIRLSHRRDRVIFWLPYYLTLCSIITFLSDNQMIEAVWPDPTSLRRVWLVRLTLTCFSCDWESGFMTLGSVYPASTWTASVSLPHFLEKEGGWLQKGGSLECLLWADTPPPHHQLPSTVFFSPLNVLSIALTRTLSGKELGIREVQWLIGLPY